ncbi:UNVERIFIED_CONTAM: hypothetical protein GTU68_054254, partial [Idotea baltica]|nr:hypothetical protein [Idotea baltica]
MVLSCPIPDDQNTRGRKIYRPELSSRSLALVTTKPIPQVSGFPVFTRSGEVMVRMKETHERISIPEEKLEDLKVFHMFTFTHVLRLEKYPIKFRPANAKSTFFIAPLLQENGKEEIDWEFVEVIRKKGDHKP